MIKYIILFFVPLFFSCGVNKKISATNKITDTTTIELVANTTSSISASSNQSDNEMVDEFTFENVEEQIIDSTKRIAINRKISRVISKQKNRAYQKIDTLYNHSSKIDTITYHNQSTSVGNVVEDITESQHLKYIAIICICIVIIFSFFFIKKILKLFA